MSDLNINFPKRPMKVSPPRSGIFWQLCAVLITAAFIYFAILGVVFVTTLIQDLVSDFSIREAARPLKGAIIEQNTCSRSYDDEFLTDCKATLLAKRRGLPDLRREIHFLYYSYHTSNHTMKVVADPSQPEKMTTDLALDKVWNRTTTLLLHALLYPLVGLSVAWMIKIQVKPLLTRRAVVRALSNQVLRQTMLRLDSRDHNSWTVSNLTRTGARKSCEWITKSTPIFIDPSDTIVLGVTTGDGTMCMPLDTTLSWLDLTDMERRQMLEQIGPERLHVVDLPEPAD